MRYYIALMTVRDLMIAMGGGDYRTGLREVARICGVERQVIRNWVARNRIAAEYHLRLWLECGRRGIAVDPAIFGLVDPDPLSENKSRRVAATCGGR